MAILLSRDNGGSHPLTHRATLLGRDPTCDIILPAQQASRRHALILALANGHFIEDLESSNGTRVNGGLIRGRHRLHHHDSIQVPGGNFLFALSEDANPPSFEEGGAQEHEVTTPGRLPATPGISAGAKEDQEFRAGAHELVRALEDDPHAEFRLPPSEVVLSPLEATTRKRTQVASEAKLRAVLELSTKLRATLDPEVVLPRVLESLFGIFPQANRGMVLLLDPRTHALTPRAVLRREASGVAEGLGEAIPASRSILDFVVRTKQAILSDDVGADERFHPSQSIQNLRIRAVLCAPLLGPEGNCLGVIQIDAEGKPNQFGKEDLDVLIIASIQAARALELARLHGELRDLEAASAIQKSFLPAQPPSVKGLQFFDHYSAASHVGGDYYDYIQLPGNRLAITLGDVAGKGISAALLMARVSTAARFCLTGAGVGPGEFAEAVRRLNILLTGDNNIDRFVTFVVVVLDLNTFELTLVNAGHLLPLRVRPTLGQLEEMGDTQSGLPLGVFDRPYEEFKTVLEPGETLVLYTDGVTEARNAAGQFYETTRLRNAIRHARDAETTGRAILESVRRFVANQPQKDDIAIVCVTRRELIPPG